jgi:hypothetical protein
MRLSNPTYFFSYIGNSRGWEVLLQENLHHVIPSSNGTWSGLTFHSYSTWTEIGLVDKLQVKSKSWIISKEALISIYTLVKSSLVHLKVYSSHERGLSTIVDTLLKPFIVHKRNGKPCSLTYTANLLILFISNTKWGFHCCSTITFPPNIHDHFQEPNRHHP